MKVTLNGSTGSEIMLARRLADFRSAALESWRELLQLGFEELDELELRFPESSSSMTESGLLHDTRVFLRGRMRACRLSNGSSNGMLFFLSIKY